MKLRLCTLILGVLLVGACAADPPSLTPPTSSSTVAQVAAPAGISIPRIGAESSLIPLGLDAGGAMIVPDTAGQASWYDLGPRPGEPGPAIVAGHINYKGEPGIFGRLGEVQVGDDILIQVAGGKTLRFVVYRVRQVAKDAFPWAEVAARTAGSELRAITCIGTYDPATRSYADNLIVLARLA